MKKRLISLICGILLFGVAGCGINKENPILYSYNIEDINYNEDNFKTYILEHEVEDNGLNIKFSVRLELNLDGACQYYSKQESKNGITTSSVYGCEYELDGENVSVKISSITKAYEPSEDAKTQGYESTNTDTYGVKFDGELSENGKFLTTGTLKYKHASYLYYLDKGITEILIDPTNDKKYKVDGTPISTNDSINMSNNKINISEYKIIDGKDAKNNVSTIKPKTNIKKNNIGTYKYQKTIVCDAFNGNIKYFENNYITFNSSYSSNKTSFESYFFTTDKDDVYIYNLEKKYSESNMNCLKLNDKVNIIHKDYAEERQLSYTQPIFYLDSNLNEVFIDSSDLTIKRERAKYILYHKPLYNFIISQGYTKYQSQDLTGYDERVYAINGDNKVYSFYAHVRDDYNNTSDNPKIENMGVVFSASKDEVVLDFLIREIKSEYDYSFVRTNKGYYRPMVINEKECNEYADITCVYQLLYDKDISKELDSILYIDNFMIITKNGRVYYNTNLPMGI